VVERPRIDDRYFISSFFLRLCWDWITWDRAWLLGGCSPRLCRLRTDGLAPASKYWKYQSHAGDMGPVSLVACRQQRVALPPLLQWLSWERNWVRTYRSASRRAVDCVRSSFSQKQWLCPSLLSTSRKVAMRWPHARPYADWAWNACDVLVRFPLQGVHRFESPRLSDMSNRLFAAVWIMIMLYYNDLFDNSCLT
jgi:hypothetical protein